ncbi:unnamed protein product, partial [Protopolystoma xenopodis]
MCLPNWEAAEIICLAQTARPVHSVPRRTVTPASVLTHVARGCTRGEQLTMTPQVRKAGA